MASRNDRLKDAGFFDFLKEKGVQVKDGQVSLADTGKVKKYAREFANDYAEAFALQLAEDLAKEFGWKKEKRTVYGNEKTVYLSPNGKAFIWGSWHTRTGCVRSDPGIKRDDRRDTAEYNFVFRADSFTENKEAIKELREWMKANS
jgi:ribosomal protein S17E